MNNKKETAKELYEQAKFNDLIEEYSGSIIPNNIFYCLAGFISLEKIYEAYEFYKKKRKYIETNNLTKSINFLFLVLSLINDKELVKIELSRIKSLSYTNQEDEQLKNNIEEYYKTFILSSNKSDKENEKNDYYYIEMINSSNINEVMEGMRYINSKFKNNISTYGVVYYDAFCNREKFDEAKCLLLAQLYGLKFNRNISFYKDDKLYIINPSKYFKEFNIFENHVVELSGLIKKNEKTVNIINEIVYEFLIQSYMNLPNFFTTKELDQNLYDIVRKKYRKLKLVQKDDPLLIRLKEYLKKN